MYWAKHKIRRRIQRGFTFIEIMIVVVIIGLLAGAVTLSTQHIMDKAKQNRARADLSTFKSALASYYADTGKYPTNDQGLAILAPKYVDKVHNDPWGRIYQYNNPGRNGPFEVICLGSDGKEGDGNITSDDLDAAPVPTPVATPAKASP
jgi:general secretion pathway protein G